MPSFYRKFASITLLWSHFYHSKIVLASANSYIGYIQADVSSSNKNLGEFLSNCPDRADICPEGWKGWKINILVGCTRYPPGGVFVDE